MGQRIDGLGSPVSTSFRYGPNIVLNGEFSNGTTSFSSLSGAVLTAADGQMTVTKLAGDSTAYANQTLTPVSGALYRLLIRRASMSSPTSFFGLSSTPTGPLDVVELDSSIVGLATAFFTGSGAATYVRLGVDGSTATSQAAVYDFVRVQRVYA